MRLARLALDDVIAHALDDQRRVLRLAVGAAQAPHRVVERTGLREPADCAFDEIAHRGERLAQFMGDRGRHFAHRVVAPRIFKQARFVAARLFDGDLAGHVAKVQQPAVEVVVDLDPAARNAQPALRAVAARDPVTLRRRRLDARRGRELRQQPVAIRLAAIVEHVAHRHAIFEAEHPPPGFADELHFTGGRQHRDALAEVLHEFAQPRLVTPQRLLERVLRADVAKLHHHHRAPGERHVGGNRFGQHIGAAARTVAPLVDLRPLGDRTVHRADADLAPVFRHRTRHVLRLQRQQFVEREAERLAGRAIGPHDRLGFGVVQQHTQRERVEQAVEIGFGGESHRRRHGRHMGSIGYGHEHNTSARDPYLKISLDDPGGLPKRAPRIPIEAFFLHS